MMTFSELFRHVLLMSVVGGAGLICLGYLARLIAAYWLGLRPASFPAPRLLFALALAGAAGAGGAATFAALVTAGWTPEPARLAAWAVAGMILSGGVFSVLTPYTTPARSFVAAVLLAVAGHFLFASVLSGTGENDMIARWVAVPVAVALLAVAVWYPTDDLCVCGRRRSECAGGHLLSVSGQVPPTDARQADFDVFDYLRESEPGTGVRPDLGTPPPIPVDRTPTRWH